MTPLRFSVPESIANLVQYRDVPVPRSYDSQPHPGPSVTYGERYPIFRHPMATPLGDHVFQTDDLVGGAYPWISLDGGTLSISTSKGVGDYLDLNPTTSLIQTNGGIDYCLRGGSPCEPAAVHHGSPQRRAGFALLGEDLVVDIAGQRAFQWNVLDHPLNEARRSLSRVTLTAFRADGPWSPHPRLPVGVVDRVRVHPDPRATVLYQSVNNNGDGVSFLGDLETIAGELAHPEEEGDYLLYTGLVPSGPWIEDLDRNPDGSGGPHPLRPGDPPPPENYSRFGTTLLTDFTRAFDVSGNLLRVELGFGGAAGGGAFFPYNDPVGSYSGPLGDRERELQIGRVGQGAYLSSDGEIRIEEDAASRPGTLADYDHELGVAFWVRPLEESLDLRLARGPAFTIRFAGTKGLEVRSRAVDQLGADRDVVARVPLSFRAGDWYHIAANSRAAEGRQVVDVWVNGRRVERENQLNGAVELRHGAGPTVFGPGGSGLVADRVLVLDELAISKRRLQDSEIARLALAPSPRTTPGARARLGPLEDLILAAGLDPDEAWVPAENPPTAAKYYLGRRLFFDPRLSTTGTVSCATCHVPALGFGDAAPTSTGVTGVPGTRHSPHIVNRVFQHPDDRFTWDGRFASLEEQVVDPFRDPDEMGIGVDGAVGVVASLPADYDTSVFGAFGHGAAGFTAEELSFALATFVRSLIVGDSNYERWLRGDASALSASEQRGLGLFEQSCIACHHGAALSDNGFHDIGLFDSTAPGADLGRGAVTGRSRDQGAFRTPGLRDLDLRQNVLGHDGTHTLSSVVDSYGMGGLFPDNPARDRRVRNFGFTDQERADLEAFLLNGLRSNERSAYAEVSPWP